MTTATAEQQSATTPLVNLLGRDILGAIVTELKTMPESWHRMGEKEQSQAIARLRDKTRGIVQSALRVLVAGAEYKAIAVELEGLTFKDGLKGTFKAPKGAEGRHELADAEGTRVLIVLADPERYLEHMDEVKAAADQLDLFGGDYDPAVDRPRYRRDEAADERSPQRTGLKSWAELMGSLNAGVITKEEAEKEYGGPLPETAPEEPDPLGFLDAISGPVQFGAIEWPAIQLRIGGDVVSPFPENFPELTANEGETLRQAIDRHFPGAVVELSPPLVFGSANEEIDARADRRVLLERLFAVGMTISLGALEAFSFEQIDLTVAWLDRYLANPDDPANVRPHFLPLPDPGYKPGDDNQQTNEG